MEEGDQGRQEVQTGDPLNRPGARCAGGRALAATCLAATCWLFVVTGCTATGTEPVATPTVPSAVASTSSPPPSPTTATDAGLEPLTALIDRLHVAPQGPMTGYSRSLFEHWIDADSNSCNTRCEVLRRQRRPALPGLPDGGWISGYDGYSTPNRSELDIDHVVPLGEAWSSGAASWDPTMRRAFANDLESGELRAVTEASNRSKGDRDPARWQPSARSFWCQYVTDWVSVKLRWGLTADPAEVRALTNMSRGCAGVPPGVSEAPPTSTNPPNRPPDPSGAPYYANCREARAAGAAPLRRGAPGYRNAMDGDGDGIACE